jgi:hypothetical protein
MHTQALTSLHDHWPDVSSRGRLVAMKPWVRHFTKQHAVAGDIWEWSFAAGVALLLAVGSLIANA